jgi:MSHA pilin protein MshD
MKQHYQSYLYQGFTLIELAMTIVILGFTSVILIPFFTSITHSPDPLIRQRAIALGQSMIDEILSKKWDEDTPTGGAPICSGESNGSRPSISNCSKSASTISLDTGESSPNRNNWDDVDDYNGYSESDSFTEQDGDTFTLTGFSRSATVTYIPSDSAPIETTTPVGTTTSAQSTDTKRIVVTVSSPLGETLNFVAILCNF